MRVRGGMIRSTAHIAAFLNITFALYLSRTTLGSIKGASRARACLGPAHRLPDAELHSMCLPLRERLVGLKRKITAMANTMSDSLMTMPMAPPAAGEAIKKLKLL